MKLVVRISREVDGRYRAQCPALPGCRAFGQSRDEAAQRIAQEIAGYLSSLDVVVAGDLQRQIVVA